MSYNWYCYGQTIVNGEWKALNIKPLSDCLKWYIDFDNVPDCFKYISFKSSEEKLKELGVAPEFINEFRINENEVFCSTDAYIVIVKDFIDYFKGKVSEVNSKLSSIFKCMGIDGDIDWGNVEESIYCMNEDNKLEKKCIPISKLGILEIAKCIEELEKYHYLLNIAHIFETVSYNTDDWQNEKKAFLLICE